MPSEAALAVLMVQEVDEPVRGLAVGSVLLPVPAGRQGRFEVLAEAPGQLGGDHGVRCSCIGGARSACCIRRDRQIVREDDPVAFLHRPDFVAAVRVERDQRELPLRGAEGELLSPVLDDERAAREAARERHHQGADHLVCLLGILVREEELAGAVDQQIVQLGLDAAPVGQAEVLAQLAHDRTKRAVPAGLIDAEAARGDLPRVTDGPVEERILPLP